MRDQRWYHSFGASLRKLAIGLEYTHVAGVPGVLPEWVSQGDDGYLMRSLRGFEAVAVRGMQELSAENEALKADAEALRADATALKAQLVQQNARLNALEAALQR